MYITFKNTEELLGIKKKIFIRIKTEGDDKAFVCVCVLQFKAIFTINFQILGLPIILPVLLTLIFCLLWISLGMPIYVWIYA